MLNDGFQFLEQRDANDNITKSGTVSKKSAFATSDNKGIYDVIAEDLRVLYEDYGAEAMEQLKKDVSAMYEDMKTNPSFGSTAAAASAKEALAAAKQARDALTTITADMTELSDIEPQLDTVADSLATIKTLAASASTSATSASSSATIAKNAATAAAASNTSAKAWAVSTGSPDGAADTSSSTGKTQSSRTWALYSESEAKAAANTAKNVQTVMSNAVAQLKSAFAGASKLIMYVDGAGETSPIISRMKCDDGTTYDISIVRAGTSEPVTGIDTYLKED